MQAGCGLSTVWLWAGPGGGRDGERVTWPEVRLLSSACSSDTAAAAPRQVGGDNTEGQRHGGLVRSQSR